MYYRIRTRTSTDKIIVIADNIPTLEEVYKIVLVRGIGTPRKFYIDEVNPKLFSKLSAREAKKRLEDMKNADNN